MSLAVEKLTAQFPRLVLAQEDMAGQTALVVQSGGILQAAAYLKSDPELQFDFLMDLAGADYLGFPREKPGRFCVAYQFFSLAINQRLCLKVYLPCENPQLPSLAGLYAGAKWLEREVWDMFGIKFEGHPDLRRILMYDEFQGHPLRKDYPLAKMQPRIPMREAVDYERVRQEWRAQQKP